MTSRPAPGAAATAFAVTLLATLAGCVGNDGGATRCDEFTLMSDVDRTSVVEELLGEQSGEDPTEGTVQLTVSATTYHCASPDAEDDLVEDVLG